jgi:hypothetical protein
MLDRYLNFFGGGELNLILTTKHSFDQSLLTMKFTFQTNQHFLALLFSIYT